MKRLLFALITGALLTSCSKEEKLTEPNAEGETICLEGSIQWGGDPAADGSGWTFVPKETNTRYFLDNLPEMYKQDDLSVNLCLKQTNKRAYCYCINPPFVYTITSIKVN